MKEFNSREAYTAYVAATVKTLTELCYKHKLPLFLTVAVRNTANGTEYLSEYISPAIIDVSLQDDQLSRHVNVMNGFDTVLPEQPDEIDIPE